jgi:hypothetical protein
MSFVQELNRRNVFRVAALYLVATWLILQVADVGVSLLGLPAPVRRFIFLILTIGFPLVLIISWVYEITEAVPHRPMLYEFPQPAPPLAALPLSRVHHAGIRKRRLLRTPTPAGSFSCEYPFATCFVFVGPDGPPR